MTEQVLYAYFLSFAASFVFIFLKSWQQLNVVHKQYWWIVPTSMCMAVMEVAVIANVAKYGWGWLCVSVGLGGGLGSLCSTYLHDKLLKWRKGN